MGNEGSITAVTHASFNKKAGWNALLERNQTQKCSGALAMLGEQQASPGFVDRRLENTGIDRYVFNKIQSTTRHAIQTWPMIARS
jgi:hypothetical protein